MKPIIDYFLNRSLFVNLLSIIITVAGVWVITNMNRAAFPNIEYDIVTVNTLWPGAASKDVERLITNPLEESIKRVDDIKEYRSSSIEGRSVITITIDPDAKDSQDVIDDLRSAIDQNQDLPKDIENPLLTELTTTRLPVIQWALKRPQNEDGTYKISYKELRQLAETLENRFLTLNGVARVQRRGWNDTEIYVDLDLLKMRQYLVGSNDVVNALRQRNVSLPAGDILENNKEIIVRTVGEFSNVKEIREVPIRSNEIGASVKIKNIAFVYEDFSEADYLEGTENSQTIGLTVVKRASADIIDVVEETQTIVEDFQKVLPEGVKIVSVNDYSYFVKRRLNVLLSNGVIGLSLVLIVLFLFLGWRTALMVALGIPISFGIAFIVMSYTGMSLNLISMFGLIVVLGLIVDDAIIVSENFYRHMEAGKSPFQAASLGTSEVIAPVFATIVTSMAAFAPLMFMSGIFGKFIFFIPFVIIICLIGSLVECFLILPAHLYDMNKNINYKAAITKKTALFDKVRNNIFEPSLNYILDHKKLFLGGLSLLLFLSIAIQALFGSFKLFPSAVDVLYIKIEAPIGTTKEDMEKIAKEVGKSVERLPKTDLESYIYRIGIQSQDPNDPFTKRGGNFAMLKVYLYPEVDRRFSGQRISDWLANENSWLLKKSKESNYENDQELELAIQAKMPLDLKWEGSLLSFSIDKAGGGPPVGKPVAIEILGTDFSTLKEIASQYKKIINEIPGVQNINDDFLLGKDEIRVKVNEDITAQVGVSVLDVANALNTGFEGSIATSIRRLNEEVDIRVRLGKKYHKGIESIKKISVSNRQGNLIPITRLASFERGKSITAINHLDGQRLLTVTADIDLSKNSPSGVVKAIKKQDKDIFSQYPQYTIQFGGENKDTEESLASLQRTFIVGLLIIFMILASLFTSLIQPFIILSAIPFSLIGVILAFFFHQEPFSFLALMGLIGLAGVVINDSIVLVDFGNKLKKEKPNVSNKQIVLEATSMRLRPVLLTTFTTVGGLLPTAYGLGGYDPFLVPMALSFAWGLLFSTALILGFVPVLYNIVLDWQDKKWNPCLVLFSKAKSLRLKKI